MGDNYHVIWGEPTIADEIRQRCHGDEGNALRYKISPLSFYQVNSIQTERLYSTALEYAGLTGEETVWDLYCGIGTISLFLAKEARIVYGVEQMAPALSDSREAGTQASKAIMTTDTVNKEDVIVVDPPRKGCDYACLDTMVKAGPKRIVYVSCDPATLARDVRFLCENGYELKCVRPCDMFPNTYHVETVVSLSLKKDSPKIEISMKPGEDSLYEPQDKGTYEKIKAYVLEKYGFKVSNLYIAQTKDKCGLDKRLNYNLSKKDDPHVPECPKEKEDAIMDAFRHFGLIE